MLEFTGRSLRHVTCNMLKSGLSITSRRCRPGIGDREANPQLFFAQLQSGRTLEGIARWRLLEEQVHRSFQQTESALAWLVEQGFLEEVETVGSSRIFRLAPQGQEKTARFLAGEKSAPKDKKKPEQ